MFIEQGTALLLTATAETVTQQSNDDMSNIIGIGGILATIIVGIITCIVTWKLTKLSIKQNKLTYSTKILNILSNSIQGKHSVFSNLTVTYGNKNLKNPCLLLLEIENTGNNAIVNPPIGVKVGNNTEIIPGYFQDIPSGYETKWKMQQTTSNSCSVALEHINPKQVVKACFFLDNPPENVVFECPMKDITIQEKGDRINEQKPNFRGTFGRLEKATCSLLILTILLFISTDLWMELLYTLNWYKWLPAPAICIILFVLLTLVISILFNVFGIKKLDNYIISNKTAAKWIVSILGVLSIMLTSAILYNIFITNFIVQIIIGVVVIFMLAVLIHILCIDKTK